MQEEQRIPKRYSFQGYSKNKNIFELFIKTNLTLMGRKEVPTTKLANQLVAQAIEFADPRAPEGKISETKNHGIEPKILY